MDSELNFWRSRLADQPVGDLPTDRPRTSARSADSAVIEFQVPADTTERLRSVSGDLGATLCTALSTLLGRYAATDDVSLVAGTTVTRTDLSGDPTFREVLGRVRQTATDQPDTTLFPVCFGYSGAQLSPASQAEFDLVVRFTDTDTAGAYGGLGGQIQYSTALFDEVTVRRLAAHLVTLLTSAAMDADQRIGDLAILDPAERGQLVGGWQGEVVSLPGVGGVHELIVARALSMPDAVAVVSGGVSLTYGGLLARANRLAHLLRGRGVGAESVVGLCLPRGVDMVVAMVGVWQAGAAYLPLDPDYPAERLEFMLADSGVRVLVGHQGMTGDLSVESVVWLDDLARPDDLPVTVPEVLVRPDQLAYVICTSGSTGRPKGVQVAHRSVVGMVTALAPVLCAEPGVRVLQFASFSFDAAVLDVAVTLASGGTLVVAGSAERTAPEVLTGMIGAQGVSAASVVPSLLGVLDPDEVSGIRTLLLGAERLTQPVAQAWASGRTLVNTYGPTEATVMVTTGAVTPDLLTAPPIGAPVANARLYVLDARMNPVPVGVAGEVYIAGPQVARGYRAQPTLTAERFLPDPFTADGTRMYRSGDRARWLADGTLDFIGRADDQVKVRGFRIEPGEIEAVLTAHPQIRTAVVTAFGDIEEQRLAAYLVPEDAAHGIPAVNELREHVQRRLPAFMVPAVFTELAALPLTPNGKLDRSALPAPDGVRPELDGFVPPATASEELLAGIWQHLLGVDRVGATDNFFELGGHSLLATQVVSRIREVFGVELALATLFDRPTIAGLGAALDSVAPSGAEPQWTVVSRDEPLPLSFAQQRLWFLDQLEPGSVEYNLPLYMPWDGDGDLDVVALGAALDAVVARHEVLRTRLVAGTDGTPYQVIDPANTFPLPVVDVSDSFDPVREAERLALADAAAPFDLAAGPLIRGALIRLDEDQHLLVLLTHHVVSDEWSARILRREVSALYEAFRAGEPDPLPPLPVQYADFAAWQRRWLDGEVLEAQRAYWKATLADAPVLELPTDRPRPPVRSAEGAMAPFVVPAETADALRALSRERGTTMFMTLLAALDVLLGRYAGSEDVVVGTPVANRNRAETEDLIGFFVNTLVMRADLSGDPSFRELLGRVRETALGAYAHQDLPFEQLVDELVTERDRSRTPLFQVFFSYGAGEGEAVRGAAEVDQEPGTQAGEVAVPFDLWVMVEEAGDGTLKAGIQFSTALFDAVTVERMAAHLVTLLGAVAGDADRRVGELPLLEESEWDELTRGWNDTAAALPVPVSVAGVHEWIAGRALSSPDVVAVVSGGVSVTYGGLLARASRLAHHLRQMGVGSESVVALCLPRGVDMVVAALGVWQAGAAYLPLDPDFPVERLEFMLADSGASVLVGYRAVAGHLPVSGRGGSAVWLDDPQTAETLAAFSSSAPEVAVSGAQLAYVLYTSGSTGRPKGVQVAHGSLVSFLSAIAGRPGLDAGDVLLAVTTLGFDIAGLELWLPLVSGARVVVADGQMAGAPGVLAGELARVGATVMQATPATWQMLVSDGWEGVPGLRALCGGEALPASLAGALVERTAGVWNMYGPTETTIWSACDPVAGGVPAIGSPIADTQVYVLDQRLAPVPIGVAGELFIGGGGVTRGYLGRPALTAERFVADPFTAGGGRLYRTGDRVRWLADGRLEFLGRADDQLKVRGFRIEPGEIGTVLTGLAQVSAAVVTGHGEGADRRLVAYLVPADPGQGIPAPDVLREHVRRSLPDYMVPSLFVELAALPLTPNGKIDRAALPAPDASRAGLDGFSEPSGATEELLAGIWAQVVGVERVGATDGFFDLGGHSLLATLAVSRIREAFGVEVSLAALFDAPTVRGLASVIDRSARDAAPPMTAVARDSALPLPLSFAQQRLWFLDQLEPGSPEYNMSTRLRLTGDVDVTALRAALDAVVVRHEVLRTRLVADAEGVPHQLVDPPAPLPLRRLDVSDGDDPRGAAEALIIEEALTPFDLAQGPLVRATLVRLAPDEHVLALSMHHVAFDEWSDRVLQRELLALYEAFRAGEPDPLPPLALQYADFAAWQRNWLTGDVLDSQVGYWRAKLADVPVLDLPTDRPRRPVRSTDGSVARFSVPEETADALRRLSREHGTTMFMTLLAAFDVLLARYADTEDVAVGTPVANRNRAETEDLIGFFVNTLVMRTDLSGDPSFTEVLRRVRETALGAYAHQDLPFEQLVDDLVVERDRSRTPLFQALFGYTTEGRGGPSVPGSRPVKFDLMVNLGEDEGALAGEIQYSTALFDAGTIERMAGHLVTLLQAVTVDADRRVGELPLLTAAERDLLLHEWTDTVAELPAVAGMHELIAGRAAATPDAVAVVSGELTLTYSQLMARANRLSHHLRGLGVATESVVALCLERGPDMVAAVLAVWQAGGAYLPLDPDYPRERLEFMLADSGASTLVGHRAVAAGLAAGGALDAVVWLDDPDTRAELALLPATSPGVEAHPQQLAYVIYTSGSTGRPKGVQITHRGVLNRVSWMQDRHELGASERVLHKTPLTFDASVWELFWPLSNGAELVIAEPGRHGDLDYLVGLLESRQIAVVQFVPSLFKLFVSHTWPSSLPSLRAVFCGGEALSASDVAHFHTRNATAVVANLYGPTENTIDAASTVCRRPDDGPGGTADWSPGGLVPIGEPLTNVRLLVLDDRLNPVPVGVAGELFIAGASLARAYGGRPALTAERFVADPYAGDGSRAYRSGDQVRWRADGRLEFLSRVDHQVKVRGFRIEPGEVEAVLAGHPAVRSAVVTTWGEAADRALVAHLVPDNPAEGIPATAELREHVRRSVPEFMVPSVFVEVAALPLTPNGKLDRAALPAPETGRTDVDGFVAPSGAVEELLAGIWHGLLPVDRVGAEDNFFELGGHSLLATQIVSRVRDVIGAEIPLATLFDHPTVRGLATAIAESAGQVEVRPVTPVGRDRELPLSFAQQRLWFLDQLEPGSLEYSLPMRVRMGPDLDVPALQATLGAVVARHEVLRTRLVAGPDGVPHQLIDPPSAFPLPLIDVSTEGDPLHAAGKLVAADEATPFDLADGPLIRAMLIRVAPDEHVLALSMHHVVSDEWSTRIFQRELAYLYDELRAGRTPSLPAPAVQYADFAVWQRQWLTGEVLDGQLAYWRGQLGGAPVLELPTDRPRPAVWSPAGASTRFTVGAETMESLRALARRSGTTMFMTLLAAFDVLLSRQAGTDDVVVGTPVANRNRAETEELIGFFVNTLVMRADLSGDPTFTELLGRVRSMALDAYAHQDLPFEQLVDDLVVERDRSRSPLFQVLFNYFTEDGRAGGGGRAAEGGPVEDGRASLDPGPDDSPGADSFLGDTGSGMTTRFDLRLVLTDAGGALNGQIEYSTALFDPGTVGRTAAQFGTLLDAVAQDAERRLGELPLLDEDTHDVLVHGWNDTARALPAVGGVHELIVAAAAREPGATAVRCGETSVGYGELLDRSGRLAHVLRGAGVGDETVVAVCLPRGVDMIVAVLAVWLAGGAYLPLDPEYPVDRLEFMLADSGAGVLLGTDEVIEELPVGRTRTIVMDDPAVRSSLLAMPSAPPEVPVHPHQSAYVIYTSGSTGRPKGVQVTHGGAVSLVTAQREALGTGPGDVVLQFAPFGFDASVWELLMALASGGTLVVAEAADRAEPGRLAALAARTGVSVATVPPSLLDALGPDGFSGVSTLITAGERLDGRLAAQWSVGRRLFNAYGPTETTVCATVAGCAPDRGQAPPIGGPVANTRVYVLDQRLRPVPVGVAGELFIAGAQLARGYLGRAALTAERFLPDPFTGDGTRMYRSGDRVRWLPDGQLEFLGRTDDQVKVRGFRIEPGEVEALLTTHPMVRTAVVTASGRDTDRRLLAYLVPADQADGIPSVEELRAYAGDRLPTYMVPSVFVELAELPLTTNGKVDRAALPEPADGARAATARAYVAPRTGTERILAETWTELLGVARVGVEDSFFDLGGHSLLATQLVSRIRDVFGVDLTLATVFEEPTIAAIAAAVGADDGGEYEAFEL